MQKFFSSHDRVAVHQVKQMLDDAGVPVLLKNDFIQGAIGEIPVVDNDIEVWLVDSSWEKRADKLLQDWQSSRVIDDIPWDCTACGAENEGNFGVCWACQASR